MDILTQKWRSNAAMIFGATVALLLFGLCAETFASLIKLAGMINSILGTVNKSYVDGVRDVLGETWNTWTTLYYVFQSFVLISWVIYTVGLYQFRKAQISDDAIDDVRSIFKAYIVGLIAAVCSLISIYMPFGTSWLFSVPAWFMNLVAFYMMRDAFGDLASETTWSVRAVKGASQLRKYAKYNITMMYYSVIVLVVMGVIVAVGIAEMHSSDITEIEAVANRYAAITVIASTLLGLYYLYLVVMQLVYRLLGWYNVWKGGLREDVECDDEVAQAAEEPVVAAAVEDGIETAPEARPEDRKNKGLLIGGIAVGVALAGGLIALCARSASVSDEDAQFSEFVPVITFDEDRWQMAIMPSEERGNWNEYLVGYFPAEAEVGAVMDGVFWVKEGGKYKLYSIKDASSPLINREFDDATDFCSGRAAVSVAGKNIEIIDTDGKIVTILPDNIGVVHPFSKDGLAVFSDTDKGLYGYIDRDGKVAIAAKYESAGAFSEGYAVVNEREIINADGEKHVYQFPADFHPSYDPVSEGLIGGRIYDCAAYFNVSDGSILYGPNGAEWGFPFEDGYAVIRKGDLYGIMNTEGEQTCDFTYPRIMNLGDGLFECTTQDGNYTTVINAEGKSVAEPQREDMYDYKNLGNGYLALVCRTDGHAAILDHKNHNQRCYVGRTVKVKAIGNNSQTPYGWAHRIDLEKARREADEMVGRDNDVSILGITPGMDVVAVREMFDNLKDLEPADLKFEQSLYLDGLRCRIEFSDKCVIPVDSIADDAPLPLIWNSEAVVQHVSIYREWVEKLDEAVEDRLLAKGYKKKGDGFEAEYGDWIIKVNIEESLACDTECFDILIEFIEK